MKIHQGLHNTGSIFNIELKDTLKTGIKLHLDQISIDLERSPQPLNHGGPDAVAERAILLEQVNGFQNDQLLTPDRLIRGGVK